MEKIASLRELKLISPDSRKNHKRPDVELKDLVGKQFVAQVTQTRTGSRNKVEFGTIGPVPSEEKNSAPEPDGSDDEDMFSNLPL